MARYDLLPRSAGQALAGLCASIILMSGTISGTVTAQGSGSRGAPSANDGIWCGLWAGSNFDVVDNCPADDPSAETGATTDGAAPGSNEGSMTTGSGTSSGSGYVALGDSVAAGLGLPAGTYTSSVDRRCGRSDQGYPALVASTLDTPLLNAACSGATTGDLVTRQSVDGPNITAQLDTAFRNGTPQLITLTAGANDVHWADFIRICYAYDCTRSSYDIAARAYLAAMQVKLAYALAEISVRSGGAPPTVIITGYYNPLSAACASQQSNLTAAEADWLASQSDALNQAIRDAAAPYGFVRFAPVSFAGHDICSADPWVQGTSDVAPFHPTARGQAEIARAVLRVAMDR